MSNSNVCVVPGCNNIQDEKISLHEFPLIDYNLSLQWLNAINKENWVPSRDSKVCCEHFKLSDFEIAESLLPYKMKLKSTAVPSCKLDIPQIVKAVEIVEKCSYHLPLAQDAHFCCVWGCTINSVTHPKNAFHLLPINHQLSICDCIGLRTPIDPIDFLSKSLEICDQHFKQNAMLLYINTEITSESLAATTKNIREKVPVFFKKSSVATKLSVAPFSTKPSNSPLSTKPSNSPLSAKPSNSPLSTKPSVTPKESTPKIIEQNEDVILNEEDLLHFDFSLNAKQKSTPKYKKSSPKVLPQNNSKPSILREYLNKSPEKVVSSECYDIDNICRICLEEGELYKIYGKTYQNILINDMVESCINLKNPREKSFPQKVCKTCLVTLKIVYHFLNKCKRSTNILENFIKQQKYAALESLNYDHDYDKTPPKTRINLQELMQNAGINIFDTFGTNDIEATVTEPEEILTDTIPEDVIQKIKNTKIKETARKVPKNVLETITEKADLNIGGKKFILAKAFTCKKCKEIFFSQENFNEHVHLCNFKPGESVVSVNYKKCTKCPKIFKNQYQEITHRCEPVIRKKRNPLKCYKCNLRLKCLSMFANHKCDPARLRLVGALKRNRVHKCKVCEFTFPSYQELLSHKKLAHPQKIKSKTPKCGYCSIDFNDMDELKKHRKESHGQSRIITCPTCMKQMTAAQYSNHKLIHSIERRFCCEFCGKRFKSPGNFRSHVNKVHLGLKPYICDICNRAYNSRTKMLEHRNVHTGTKKYMCDLCGARFTYKSCLASHIRKKRCGKTKGSAKEHKCPHCDEVVMSYRLLIQHKREAHGIRKGTSAQKTYSCEVCKIPCDSAADLRAHETVHGEKMYICDQPNCRRPFFTSERLKRHLRVHETVNAKCEICSKGFYSKLSLTMHMKTHTGEKNYHCSYCPKQFTQQGHLISHTRTHTGAKPYQCPYCDRAFAMSGNLTVHIRTHTGHRPYECNYCDQAFFDASSRKRHMVQKHAFSTTYDELSNNESN